MSEGGLSQSSVSAEQFMAQAQSQAHTQGLSQRVRAQYLAGGGDEAARGQLGGLLSEIVSPDGNTHYCAACKRDHTKDGPFPGRTAHYLTPDQFVVERAHLEELRKNADRANAIADEATRLLDENKSLALEVTRLRRKLGE